jgi:hypothetical protein
MGDEDLVHMLRALFSDIQVRSAPDVRWGASGRQLPVQVSARVGADGPVGSFELPGGDVADRVVDLAAALQDWLFPQLGISVPPCPHNGRRLRLRLRGATLSWTCPSGDFECELGRYLVSLWPPKPGDKRASPMLAERLDGTGVRWSGCSVGQSDETPVARVTLYAGEDEALAHAAAAPLDVEIEWEQPIVTERVMADGRPTLRLAGGGMRMLADLTGTLGRPRDGDDADILVNDVPVRLEPEHRIGGPGEPLLLDAAGVPFADVGDIVSCGGGFAPPTGIAGERRRPFYAWEISVLDG